MRSKEAKDMSINVVIDYLYFNMTFTAFKLTTAEKPKSYSM